MLNGAKANAKQPQEGVQKGEVQAKSSMAKSSIPEVFGMPPKKGGKYIEDTRMPGLVKQEWDWHLNRKNPMSPEFADSLLESGKEIYKARRLDFGNKVPAKGWDSMAAKQAGIMLGIHTQTQTDIQHTTHTHTNTQVWCTAFTHTHNTNTQHTSRTHHTHKLKHTRRYRARPGEPIRDRCNARPRCNFPHGPPDMGAWA
jgi:hypothetical protein